MLFVNLFIPRSDQNVIFSHNIIAILRRQVTEKKESYQIGILFLIQNQNLRTIIQSNVWQ